MAFDFFSQPQGPNIDVRLFPAAASAGVEAGNAQKTLPEQILGGISTGMKLYNQYQDIQKTQQQIDAEPLQQQLKQEELERMQLQNDVMALDAKVIQENEDLYLRAKKAELEQKALEIGVKNEDFKNKDLIFKDLEDPLTSKNALINPKYQGTLARNPDLAEAVVKSLSGRGMLTPEEEKRAFAQVDFSKMMQYRQELDKVNEANRFKELANREKIEGKAQEGQLAYLRDHYGLSLSELASHRIETYPAGVKTFDRETGLLDRNESDKDTTGPGFDASLTGKWDVVIDGKKANVRLSGQENNALSDLQNLYVAQGLVPKNRPSVSAPVTDSSETTDTATPYSNRFSKARTENENIVTQRGQDLLNRAQKDPQLLNRLEAKGLLKEEIARGIATPIPAPQAAPTPGVTQGALIPGVTSPQTEAPNVPSPTALRSPASLAKNVSDVHRTLPTYAKKYVDPNVMSKVLDEPLLKGLDPLYQAVAAVESGGVASAKNKKSSAEGLFQLTDAAAKDMKVDKSVPNQNVRGGIGYLNKMLAQFGGNEIPALMAYYLGAAPIDAAINQVTATDYESVLFGLQYLRERGRFEKLLTDDRMRKVAKYPLQVLAYKEAFQAMGYV